MNPCTLMLMAAMWCSVLGAPPQINTKDATIIQQENDFNGLSPWRWSFKNSDGSERAEEGELTADGSPDVSGSYTRVSPKTGAVYVVTYRADKHGFHVISRPLGKDQPGEAYARLHRRQF
ncbi:endocuticle structural glycoprotein SgAbd-5-like [Schistocerca americana]|uniref:endocuticle structural glycoprotein SgAbd-5-like n=1 Tax=Schistocerca americana TaxID=7009 RepID=UPI001F50407B|nr:endocuticle structural glycoprotein SgAbd-5-like [Schistocerca americana]